MTDEIVYEEAVGSLEQSRTQVEEARDDAMNWLDTYYQSPEQADLLSTNLDNLLNPTSEYMVEAQKASREARDAQGFLESGFTEGMGTVAAIDNAFDTALGDTYVDIFNVNETNEQYRSEYITAYESAISALMAQNNLSYSEHGYSNIVKGMDEAQQDLMELKDKEFEYADLLQSSQHEDNLDRLHFKHANDLANRVVRNKSGLQNYYLSAYTGIMGSDIPQNQKYDQLVGLGYQIDEATKQAVDQQYTNVGDNPYGISTVDYLDSYDQGDKTDEPYVFTKPDAEFEYVKFREVFDKIYVDIREQCNHACRDESPLWFVLNDLLYTQLNSLDKNSQEFLDKMEYYNQSKYDVLGDDPTNDEIKQYMLDIYNISSSEEFSRTLTSFTGPARRAIVVPDEGDYSSRYREPFTYIRTTFNSETGELEKTEVNVPGDAAYMTHLYREYENSSIFSWTVPPEGYEEAKAACKRPMQWDNGECVNVWDY